MIPWCTLSEALKSSSWFDIYLVAVHATVCFSLRFSWDGIPFPAERFTQNEHLSPS